MVIKATKSGKPHVIQVRVPISLYEAAEKYRQFKGIPSFNAFVNMLLVEKFGMNEKQIMQEINKPEPLPVPSLDASLDEHYTYLYSMVGNFSAMEAYRTSLPASTREALFKLECDRAPSTQ